MADTQFLRLNNNWALACDPLQWVLQRCKGVRKAGAQAGQEIWEAVAYVRSTKAMLSRCMREHGVPAGDIAAAMAVLPDDFDTFRECASWGPGDSISDDNIEAAYNRHRGGVQRDDAHKRPVVGVDTGMPVCTP